MEKGKEIIKELREGAKVTLDDATKEFFRIIEPINYAKVNTRDSINFIKDGGFKKAKEQMEKMITAYNYLMETE